MDSWKEIICFLKIEHQLPYLRNEIEKFINSGVDLFRFQDTHIMSNLTVWIIMQVSIHVI